MSSHRVDGWKADLPDHRDKTLVPGLLKAALLPRSKDLRALCPRVEDQGHIGSCTAHASTSAMEFIYKMLKRPQPELSRLFVYYATRVWVEGVAPNADNGAHIRDVMKALAKYGVCLETYWPYVTSKYAAEPLESAKVDAMRHQALYYFRCPTLTSIKASIADGYPCVGGFSVPENIDSTHCRATGMVEFPSAKEGFVGGHAVLFVGYNDKTGLLTFQNSWGTKWGDRGFGYLPYEFVTKGLADDFWTIRVEEMG